MAGLAVAVVIESQVHSRGEEVWAQHGSAVVTFEYNENEMMLAWMLDQISLSP